MIHHYIYLLVFSDVRHLRRVRREEKDLSDGCQCHRTAVAIGALAQYVRYVIEYMQLQAGGMATLDQHARAAAASVPVQ